MNTRFPSRIRRLATATTFALCTLGFLASAAAEPLTGQLTDGLTGTPIANARVQVLGTNLETTTDNDGRWDFDLPAGYYELEINADVLGEHHSSRLVNQYVPQAQPARAHVYTSALVDMGYPQLARPTGVPTTSGRLPDDDTPPLDLHNLFPETLGSHTHYTIPANQPATIRVGRRRDPTGGQGCSDSNNPIVAIHEMDLDEYVKGVLPPEIGVFQNISGASEVYKAFAIAAKSYGLWYVLQSTANPRNVSAKPPHNYTWYHIDDTACNQRYDDQRMNITTAAANAVAKKVMVKKGAPNTIDKYEYAASCGKHGSRPAYQTALVADKPPTSPCVGSWCGHNTCAAHETNPAVSSSNRCLVRGICQWGAAAWGADGKNYSWILNHYQPNIEIREIGVSAPATVRLTGYVYTDPANIATSGVSGVAVKLSNGMTATTDPQGVFNFAAIPMALGTVGLTATKTGYLTAERDKLLEAGATNWASIQIKVDSTPTPDPDPETDAGNNPHPDAGFADIGHDPEDAGTDVGTDTDTNPPPKNPTPEHPRDNTDPNALGPLISRSHGVNGGCQIATFTQTHKSPAIPALTLASLLTLAALRKRKTTR